MEVKLIIRINHAERVSIRTGTAPKNDDPSITASMGFPLKAYMERTEVSKEFMITKKALPEGLIRAGRN